MILRALVLTFAIACGSAPVPIAKPHIEAPKPPEASAEAKLAADAIAHAFELLAIESAMPTESVKLREAALTALAPDGNVPAIAWTGVAERDRELLRGAVLALALRGALPGPLPDNAVLVAARAMAFATGDADTFVLRKPAVHALFALIGGGPIVQPGMLYHQLDDGQWAVSDVITGGAAQLAGVQRGDILVSIDGAKVTHGYMDFAHLLGAPEGTQAKLTVQRDAGELEEMVLRLTPVAEPIVEARVLGSGIGYVRVWSCTHSDDPIRDAGALLANVLADFDKKKVKKLVLDLRGNAGGFPFDIASLLVDADPLMYGISNGNEQPVGRTKVGVTKTKRPIAVIVDELTAAGAEMIAFALREHAGSTIVGRPTAGALSFPTTEKLAADVTISYPLSRVGSAKTKAVQEGNRIVPDIAAPNSTAEDYAAKRDPQLDAAFALLKAGH